MSKHSPLRFVFTPIPLVVAAAVALFPLRLLWERLTGRA